MYRRRLPLRAGFSLVLAEQKRGPRLELFRDSWPLLKTPTFVAIMDALIKRTSPGLMPDEVSKVLIAHGAADQSDRPLDAD